jgi:ribose transport system permease protein
VTVASPTERPTGDATGPLATRRRRRSLSLERYALPLTFIVVIVVFSILKPDVFPTGDNASAILSTNAVLVVLTIGVLAPLTVGDLDISVAAILGLSAMLMVILNTQDHVPVGYAVVIALGASAVVGLINGFFAVIVGIDALIVTLGTGSLALGVTAWMSNNNTITGLAQSLINVVVQDQIFGVSVEFYYSIAICVLVFYLLRYTPLGRRMLIVGQAREVARLSGINVSRVRIGSLLFSAFLAGLAGILYAGTSGSAQPAGGSELLLPAYAAAFLGSTTLTPGRFNPFGSLIAVYFLATGIVGLELLGAQNFVQQIFYGAALLVAVVASTLIRRAASRSM